MTKGNAVSIYLQDETLHQLDRIVQARAALDKAKGLSGYQVANRSKVLSLIIDDFYRQQQTQSLSIHDIKEAVIPLAKEYGAKRVSLFGSQARNDANGESDVDILLEKGAIKGLQVFDFQDDLARVLGKSIDIVTTQGASDRFLNRIKKDEVVLYEAAR